jgi:alcohol dehydrogenase
MKKSGVLDRVRKLLAGYSPVIYGGVLPNPDTGTIDAGVGLAKKNSCQAVLAIGGGSVIDTAKAIAVIVKNGGRAADYLNGRRRILSGGLGLAAVPTTAGSGSEVTPFCVINSSRQKRKVTLQNDYLYPRIAVLDPELTVSLPGRETAISGMDALSHSMEAYWSVNSNAISDGFALASIRMVFANLKEACTNPHDILARSGMLKASLYAGLAFGNTKTTAVHSVSYPITYFFGVPHGLACAVTLAAFIRYNLPALGKRKKEFFRACGEKAAGGCARRVEELMKAIGLPARLTDLGINASCMDRIIEYGFTPDRVKNNPRKLTKTGLRKILVSLI